MPLGVLPIKVVQFPPDTLTFHLGDYDYNSAPAMCRTDVVIKDSASTLLEMRNHFATLDPKEQRNYVIALLVEKM